MNHSQGIESIHGREWRVFPAITTAGFYDSFSQYIELSTVSSDELRAAIQGANATAGVKVLPLLAHEQQHWADHLSTLWGRRRLIRAMEAMEARDSNDPKQFWRIIDYLRAVEADYFSTYYQTAESTPPSDGRTRPWRWQLTAGMRFNASGRLAVDRPIFFTRFDWPEGSPACRVPFSVSALLEARAMAAELSSHLFAASKLPNGAAQVEAALASKHQIDILYDPELAVYSAGAHLVGNIVGFGDAMLAFGIASQLAHVCLDLPSAFYEKLVVPDSFEPWKERVRSAIASCDPGFAFLVLTHHGAEIPVKDSTKWLEDTVRKGGLPSLAEIRFASTKECEVLRSAALVGSFRQRFELLWGQGEEIRQSHRYMDTFGSSGSSVPLPPIYCNDLSWVLPTQLSGTTLSIESWWESCNRRASQFQEFRQACGI